MSTVLRVRDLAKSFTLHTQGGVRLPVLDGVTLTVFAGECVVLADPSGAGKSTLLRAIYGNYLADRGSILLRHRSRLVELRGADPRTVLDVRRHTVGYVSQFLRVIPRVPTLDVVAEPLRALGVSTAVARGRAEALLTRLAVPARLWSLSPMTFSGGEQQRVNVARGFIAEHPLLLLDEPTAALDADSRRRVIGLIADAKTRGAAIVGTFHDREVRDAIATRIVSVHGGDA
ncbi:MAG TPA: phosphonate C-P lyase system protein PhnL [Methylomirabilota bacterium]|nr:phosphonate C-P lyase system protein PhnL [Methylomirabilota bacterium]